MYNHAQIRKWVGLLSQPDSIYKNCKILCGRAVGELVCSWCELAGDRQTYGLCNCSGYQKMAPKVSLVEANTAHVVMVGKKVFLQS